MTFAILWWGCTPPPGDRPSVTQPPPPPALPGPVGPVDVDTLPTKWEAADGWGIYGTTVLGDLTGDGYADAAVYVNEIGGVGQNGRTLLVAGPLRRSMVLPGDEVATFLRSAFARTGDATGDGVLDLRLQAESGIDTFYFLLEGPFVGVIEPPLVGRQIGGDAIDIDGDGLLDQVGGLDQEVWVTWGPASRWSGPPDLVLTPTCDARDADDYGFRGINSVEALPDVTGDGQREVWLEDDTDNPCETWLFPLPTTTPYAPATDPNAVYAVRDLDVIGDQTGDGLPDVWTWYDRRVHAAPVAFAAGEVTSAQTLQADTDLLEMHPMPYDLDGDGLTDFVALDGEVDASEIVVDATAPLDPVQDEVMVVVSGGAALESPTYAAAWDIRGRHFRNDDVLLEDGVVAVLVYNVNEVVVVDLGPGGVP